MPASDANAALRRAAEFNPNLVILDSASLGDNAAELGERLRTEIGQDNLPVVMLTDSLYAIGDDGSRETTDYLEQPFNPPMLRSRVRAWLARTRSDSPVAEVQPDATEVDESPELQRTEQAYIEALSKTNLFRHLDLTQLQNLVSSASEQVFPSGYEVLREGEPGTSVFIILSGAVRIVEAVAEGPESMFLTEMRAGDLFGEIGFLRNGPRSATVITLERTRCLVLPQKEFLETLDNSRRSRSRSCVFWPDASRTRIDSWHGMLPIH